MRREFLGVLGSAAAAWSLARRRVQGTNLATITLAYIALGLTAAEPGDFRAADTQSKDHPTARALVHMSELVSDRTQGRHRMIVYPEGVLGEQEASFEQTRTGGIDINRTNMAPLASFVGKRNVFGLPFLFRSPDHLHRILDGAMGDGILQSLEPHGFVGTRIFQNLEQGRFTRSGGRCGRLTTSKDYAFDCNSQNSWSRCSRRSAQNPSYFPIPAPRPH